MKRLTVVLFFLSCFVQAIYAQGVSFEKQYDRATKYGSDENSFYTVFKGDKMGVCNNVGKEIIQPGEYISANKFYDQKKGFGIYILFQKTTSGNLPIVFDLSGRHLFGPNPSIISAGIDNALFVCNEFKLIGAYDLSGNPIISPSFPGMGYDVNSNTITYLPFEGGAYQSTGIAPDGTTLSRDDSIKTMEYLRNYYSSPYNSGLQLYREGIYYIYGDGRERNFNKACEYFEAAGKYDRYFMNGIAQMYELGLGREQDLLFALWAYEEALKAGNKITWSSFTSLRYAIKQQDMGTLNKEAFEYFNKGVIKEFVERDYWGAREQLIKSAELGYLPAMYELGTNYLQGSIYIESADEQRRLADYWLKRSADEGYEASMNNYGVLLEMQGRPEDAFQYYLKAAELKYPPSIHTVAKCYESGIGVKYNKKLAEKYMKLSNELGYASSNDLMEMLQNHKEERREKWLRTLDIFTNAMNVAAQVSDIVMPFISDNSYSSSVSSVSQSKNSSSVNSSNNTAKQGREFLYYSTVNCFKKNGEKDELYIYKSRYGSIYRASFVKAIDLDKNATMPIKSGYLSYGDGHFSNYVTTFGIPWYFNY